MMRVLCPRSPPSPPPSDAGNGVRRARRRGRSPSHTKHGACSDTLGASLGCYRTIGLQRLHPSRHRHRAGGAMRVLLYCCAVTTVALLRRAMCRKLRSSAHCKDMKHICKEVGRGCTAVCAGAGPPCALQAQNDACRQTDGGQLGGRVSRRTRGHCGAHLSANRAMRCPDRPRVLVPRRPTSRQCAVRAASSSWASASPATAHSTPRTRTRARSTHPTMNTGAAAPSRLRRRLHSPSAEVSTEGVPVAAPPLGQAAGCPSAGAGARQARELAGVPAPRAKPPLPPPARFDPGLRADLCGSEDAAGSADACVEASSDGMGAPSPTLPPAPRRPRLVAELVACVAWYRPV